MKQPTHVLSSWPHFHLRQAHMVFGNTSVTWLCPGLSQNCYFCFFQHPLLADLHHLLAFGQTWFWHGRDHTYLIFFTFIHGCLLVPQAIILGQLFPSQQSHCSIGE